MTALSLLLIFKLFLLEYTVEEKCYECPGRYAIVCVTAGCNVPVKTVTRIAKFSSVDDALAFMNRPTNNYGVPINIVIGTIDVSVAAMNGAGMPDNAAVVGLYELVPINVEAVVVQREITVVQDRKRWAVAHKE